MVQFQLPINEIDKSDEVKAFLNRTSMSVLHQDRRGARSAFHGDTDEESEQEEHFQDICPSWMGQIFQV